MLWETGKNVNSRVYVYDKPRALRLVDATGKVWLRSFDNVKLILRVYETLFNTSFLHHSSFGRRAERILPQVHEYFPNIVARWIDQDGEAHNISLPELNERLWLHSLSDATAISRYYQSTNAGGSHRMIIESTLMC